ncbi:hypothetical protein B0T10DRAFT_466636 [Thelonectria olida]|uniref:Uncharacterized protein n=1 Tax=Thelonectria olida TaxID=1576542 RepID=A0A9P9AIU9_9HYPO|nr:hypothetical protein B0T10DRAFT_466636 [Thelonectria olida]
MTSNDTTNPPASGSDSQLLIACVALAVSAFALVIAFLQALQQYYASAIGYASCKELVMGKWSQFTHRRLRLFEFRFEVEFQTPVIFVSAPSNKRGPLGPDLGKGKPQKRSSSGFVIPSHVGTLPCAPELILPAYRYLSDSPETNRDDSYRLELSTQAVNPLTCLLGRTASISMTEENPCPRDQKPPLREANPITCDAAANSQQLKNKMDSRILKDPPKASECYWSRILSSGSGPDSPANTSKA